jgi:hypothetical protein
MNCGIGKEQGAALVKIVNKILANQLDTNSVMSKLDELEKVEKGNEQQLFQSLNGQLIPANDPMPSTPCGAPSKDQYIVAINGGGHMFKNLPHIILTLNYQKAVWLDKRQDGRIALFIDVRDREGRIAVRVDKDGFFLHPGANLFARHPDESSVVIQDEFGTDVLSVRYANPRAWVVTGSLTIGPQFGCVNGDFAAGIWINNGPPPPKR